ncbi:hypothetical protein Lal_00022888, partial [Lupinus albus]
NLGPYNEVEPYVERHKEMFRKSNPSKNKNWISKERNRCFLVWLKNHIVEELNINAYSISERLKLLANGPSIHVCQSWESRLSEKSVAWAREPHLGFSLERELSRLSESFPA